LQAPGLGQEEEEEEEVVVGQMNWRMMTNPPKNAE